MKESVFRPAPLASPFVLFLLFLLAGCGDILGSAPVPIEGVEMASTAIVLSPGDTARLRGVAIYGEYRDPLDFGKGGRPLPPLRPRWRSSDPSVATVEAGLLRAVGAGRAIVTVSHGSHTDTASVVVRAPEAGPGGVASVSVGLAHACSVGDDGQVACWGSNHGGSVGVDDPREGVAYLAPARLPGASGAAVEAGREISCYLDGAGVAHCWGREAGSRAPRPAPTSERFVALGSGWFDMCGLTGTGEVHCWGRGRSGGTIRAHAEPALARIDRECGLSAEGRVHCWDRFGRLAPVGEHPPFVRIATGFSHACGLDAAGVAYCWGENRDGGLGTGPAPDVCRIDGAPAYPCTSRPEAVRTPVRFVELAAGNGLTCGIATDGAAHCWGAWNLHGALGTGNFAPSTVPAAVVGGRRFRSLSAQESTVCGVAVDGGVHCWGGGILGDGRTGSDVPVSTTGTPAPTRVRDPV